MVGGVGSGAVSPVKAYYSYSWYIENLFSTHIGAEGGDALIYLRDMSLPTFTVNQEKYQGASLEYKFGKSVHWDDVKVTWYDTIGLLDKILQWRQAVWKPDSGLQPADQYKKTSTLVSELPEGGSENIWTLINSWPSSIKYGDLTYTQSDVKVVDVVVTYDWIKE